MFSASHKLPLHIVILAAGQGKRMASTLPKVLLPIGGKPMLAHVLETANGLNPAGIHVVIGHGGREVRAQFADTDLSWVEQAERLGTGDAVSRALGGIPDQARVLVLCGDTPLAPPASLRTLLDSDADLAILTMTPDSPEGYGRVVRDAHGKLQGVIEEKDAESGQRTIREVNSGILFAGSQNLRAWLDHIDNDNAQGEYYLTDVVQYAVQQKFNVAAITAADASLLAGANDRWQLSLLERRYQQLKVEQLVRSGVSVMDPARLDIRGTVSAGRNVILDINVILEGDVHLDDGVEIGPNVIVRDTEIATGTRILANCVIESARIGANCRIGPFARIRPGTETASEVSIGNFVEVKKSQIGAGSKANHLSYIGDTEIGTGTNIGAGTITCNYDGVNKHKTVIGNDVFIGSNTALVAPVTVNHGATIGAGSVITTDAPSGQLSLSRSKQATLRAWKRPTKKS